MKALTFIGTDTGFGINNNEAYLVRDNNLLLIDCGGTVFSELFKMEQNNHFLSNKDKIEIVITHMHDDHTGSLSTLIYYCTYVLKKKVKIIAKCLNIKERLALTGLKENEYEIGEDKDIEFIKTIHTPALDCYGFILKLNNKKIVYTGDSATLEPFMPYLDKGDELYTDISFAKNDVHLYLKDNLKLLKELTKKGIDVYLMHVDNEEEIKKVIDGTDIHLASENKLYKEDIIRIVKSYDLDPERYEVISGAAMVLYGFKEWTRDIDITVSKDYYVELLSNYKCSFERVNSEGECIFFIDNMLNFGHSYYHKEHEMIEGIPVQTKENLIALKKMLNREKDKIELEMIK